MCPSTPPAEFLLLVTWPHKNPLFSEADWKVAQHRYLKLASTYGKGPICLDRFRHHARPGGEMRLVGHGFWALHALVLAGCADLSVIHDPQTGLISSDQVDAFLKSVRCELRTFYAANNQNEKSYAAAINRYDKLIAAAKRYQKEKNGIGANAALSKAAMVRAEAIERFPYYLLENDLFGGVYLDLKVIDTFGFPTAGASSSTFDNKSVINATHSFTWLIGPTLYNQNTYEEIDNYIIEQTDSLVAGPDPFSCYSQLPKDLAGLAYGEYPEWTKFKRIRVNFQKPLAGWLMDRSAQLWHTFKAASEEAENDRIIPVQSTYNFTVQITSGVDGKYSLLTPAWNPAQVDFGASNAQSSLVTIAINGDDASLAAGAKVGTAVNDATNHAKPPYVPVGNLRELQVSPPVAPGTPRGHLLWPPTLPVPGQ
jgi:hypothetical protein